MAWNVPPIYIGIYSASICQNAQLNGALMIGGAAVFAFCPFLVGAVADCCKKNILLLAYT